MTDYDKKFEQDLERAQALSLESLALEQFKNKRLQELNKHVNHEQSKKVPSVTRAASMNESDSTYAKNDWQVSKSRPRPGSTLSNTSNALIAPPPSSLRKNSSMSDTEDLISFASPPPTNNSSTTDVCSQESFASNTQVRVIANPSSVYPQLNMQQYWPQIPQIVPQMRSGYQHTPTMYQTQVNMPGVINFPEKRQSQMINVSQIGFRPSLYQSGLAHIPGNHIFPSEPPPPALPPKNQQRLPPPATSLPPKLSATYSKVSISSDTSKNFLKTDSKSHNLIDLAQVDDRNSVRVSILQEFDPILSDSQSYGRTMSPVCTGDDSHSMCGSVYDEYYDFDFIYSGSGSNSIYNSIYGNTSISEPIYATVSKVENSSSPVPPLPPRSRMSTLDRRFSKSLRKNLLDGIVKNDNKAFTSDPDLKAFHDMVYKVRNNYKYNDPDTNMGLVISPMVNFKYNDGLSIKLRVHPDFEGAEFNKPISFTCDVTSSVEHITMQLVYDLEAPAHQNYTLKVWGFNEYLVPTTLLSDYEYVHNCIKLDEDVVLILIPDSMKDKSFARTLQDDYNDKEVTFEKIVSTELSSNITYDSLKILIETVESEIVKLEEAAAILERSSNISLPPPLQPLKVIQSIKCIINLMGDLSTLDIMQSVEVLMETCKNFVPSSNSRFAEIVTNNCNKIRLAVQSLIEMYCQAFMVNFEVKASTHGEPIRYVNDVMDSVIVRICAINRPSGKWEHELYYVSGQVYHGTRKIGRPLLTQACPKIERDNLWPSRIVFDNWLEFEDVPISNLARESRLVLQLFGKTLDTSENEDSKNSSMPIYKEEEIGWTAIQFFNYGGVMIQGNLLLSIWPVESDHINEHIYGPAPAIGCHPMPDHPMLGIELVAPPKVHFPKVDSHLLKNVIKGDFYGLDNETQQLLSDACDQDMLYKFPSEIREILWEKRHHMYHMPKALPKVLLAAHSWAYVNLVDLHGMLHAWKRLDPTEALELLLPVYPDIEVRKMAVNWIITNDDLIDYLPQLTVALRYETYENSALAQFLLHRALRSPRFSHYLFWLLSHSLPGSLPQNGYAENKDNIESICEVRHHRRMKLLLRALLAVCGESLRKCFISQQLLVKQLDDSADNVKKAKDSQKLTQLHRDLDQLNVYLNETPTSLPLSLTLKVNGIDVKSCAYFASNTLPLKINFIMEDSSVYPAIYKVGDDLQQDVLTLQMIELMDKLWLQEGLDLKMVAFNCIPTSKRKGMIEMVTKAETLRKIQTEHGLTGSFKDKPIAEWLAKHNPSELEYGRAVQNFTASCAGYCVVTYVMGICDRHNDNIMLKTSGHLFHIDFGKFLGDAQMFGNFKRDRAPFVLTSDMAYVINGGDRPTEKFHQFVDLCCQAFNIIRNNRNIFLFLMTCSGICSVTPESIGYMHKALLPELSNPEAAAHFTRLIEESLKTKFTQFNFFLHNLAQNLSQLKFSAENSCGSLLSFVPKTYSMAMDGRLTQVEVVGYRKRYDPDKYYVYTLRIYRENQLEPMEIQRTYKEFCELHQKLCIYFPLAKLHSLSTGLHMGRQNIKQVAQKRFHEISLFIKSLFLCATEIAHSDLVYTFFHPLLRDQQEDEYTQQLEDKKASGSESGRLKGQLKLSLQYSKGVFSVMVHHARGLPRLNGQEPSTYVKVYLQPDIQKSTKRKTKVVKKNCHPCFMEMLEYRMALDIVKSRTIKATVWNYDPLQENEFMGGVELELASLDLTTEITEWYPLVNLSR
ncbi:phosphatidylinositol 4-phosphate 3-kinase C2 domain-containing subunit alpha isoform X2 [Cylas formicarius]|nr:phosphatidylinositol 4-phosphate 3-kinase C2 domain-containing subunit alpha isoform X2 [Cylas formicarius]XP_060523564.1 phosphatidylinositol 4-phosphate 3-kinase C2 domain-containing subunit alpha isoform X2 [Cylas formicarius]XP_060523565.1 phosphatidylinositol 4-phosphate 3-kinase C2 domain-containing subunit alpha isoform X2 [Cylas formicarius]